MKTILPVLLAFFCIITIPSNAKEAPKKAAEEKFMRHLETLEPQAKRQKKGIWARPVKP